MRPALARAGRASLAWLAALGIAALGAPSQAAPVPPIHDLAVIEFVESPPTGLVVSGGLLGVPDSSGVFPARYQRYDLPTGNSADPGHVAGDALVFTNLRPGTYRLAMVFLSESRLAAKVLPKNASKLEDRCTIYGDSIPALTFRIADGECRYLGRIVRRSLPSLEGEDGIYKTTMEWSAGDERKVMKSLGKRKDMASWRGLVEGRLTVIDPTSRR
ncbi:MAG: hypothetical protein E6K80_01340 [Candidatus Eisenbacteria bacterium]|uniref:Carboxypeptidase regulatory-like domain-containing protein n=1 Tax=Eiseniibacteriota bacterium TaxID=2212470 RepID=A0A538UAP7_UNCEI|nr:MAG: hypothetical protein E6K80_01340 [Candidatus Eisenbacteria bacterium]